MITAKQLLLSTDRDWLTEIERIGADSETWKRLCRKCRVLAFSAGPFSCPAASILKQCMLSAGGDAIVARGTITCECDHTDALIFGTEKQIFAACQSMRGQPFGLSELADSLENALIPPELPGALILRGKTFHYSDTPLIMGVLNITPDSFSDGGRYSSVETAVERALAMEKDGASIIDIGGESTRPGSLQVSTIEQIQRIEPVIRAIRSCSDMAVSIDTTSAVVAETALAAGADMVNDVSAFSDPMMPSLVADRGVPVILMHMRGVPETMQDNPSYRDVFEDVYAFLKQKVKAGESAGIPLENILVDPGIGFGKRLEDNIVLVRRIGSFRKTGCRVVLGHSRKSFLGTLTGEEIPAARDVFTHVVSTLCIGHADILRVHDVKGTVCSLEVARTLMNREAGCSSR